MKFDLNSAFQVIFSAENRGKILKLLFIYLLLFGPYFVMMELVGNGSGSNLGLSSTYYSYGTVQPDFANLEQYGTLFLATMAYMVIGSIVFGVYTYGYYLNLFRNITAGNYSLPEVDGSHFGPGLKTILYYFAMLFAILAIGFVMGLIAIAISIPGSFLIKELGEFSQIISVLVGGFVLFVGIIAMYIYLIFFSTVSVHIFGLTNSIKAALNFGLINKAIKLFWKPYLMIMLFMLALSIAINVVGLPLAMIPYIGAILMTTGSFVLSYVFYVAVFDSIRTIDYVGSGLLSEADLYVKPAAQSGMAQYAQAQKVATESVPNK